MRHARIIASGSYAPERVLKNEWFNELLGEDVDTWLRENLTIKERRWMTDDQTTSDLRRGCARRVGSNVSLRRNRGENLPHR